MGKKLDALLGRSFKASKFKTLSSLAVSRLAVLKNHRQVRCKQARADVLQLLQISQHERALLRAEHVVREQNLLDIYVMIEGYCHLLNERVHLLQHERECPEELKEAIAGLIHAASRCGDMPELQEIRAIFTSRYGKEFTARAVELRNNCGVSPKMIQKLSTRMPSLESRMKVVQDIAAEANLVFQLEEASPVPSEEQMRITKVEDDVLVLSEEMGKPKYKDVADAAQDAFRLAGYAAVAARAAVELSRSDSQDPPDNNQNQYSPRLKSPKKVSNTQSGGKEAENVNQGGLEQSNTSGSEGTIISASSSSTAEENLKGAMVPVEKEIDFERCDDETDHKQNIQSNNVTQTHSRDLGGADRLYLMKFRE